ncbi:MAG: M1 family aminopeptidase [Bryobacteraceae bacterium]
MSPLRWFAAALLLIPAVAAAQERRPRIDVQHYRIEAEINPQESSLTARVEVRFVPEDDIASAVFELNNALNVSKVEDGSGRPVSATRSHQDFTQRLAFPERLTKGAPATLVFYYDGRLTGQEESPVSGIKFAAIHPDFAYLLYPARWFPISGYTTDRFTAELRITVPQGFRVLAPGLEKTLEAPSGKSRFLFEFTQPSFPGSIAVVRGEPASINAEGVTTTLYFRDANREMAGAWGQEFSRAMAFFTSLFGLPPQANLTIVETESGAPNGYAAPGLVFIASNVIGKQVNVRLVANQVARQWWGILFSPVTRSHIWITNGAARHAELLYLEHLNGTAALEAEARDLYVDALTINDIPLLQAGRIEDYSPEFWAVSASKGGAVYHMLRFVIGDEPFRRFLKEFPAAHPWASVSTEDVRKAAEAASGQKLDYFFLQWIESSGAPEFKLEYTVYRTQKGFRVVGKVSQDLDTFRMPVDLKIETEGNPETKRIEVVGTSSEFVVETFGRPKKLILDPDNRVIRFSDKVRVAVAIRRGEQFAEIGEFNEALKEYQRALEVNRYSSLAHYRIGEIFFLQNNLQSAANAFREALNGDLDPPWTEVWSHINLGKIFDITGQRERALNEYRQAIRTKDNTQGAQEEAARYLKEPYQRQRPQD